MKLTSLLVEILDKKPMAIFLAGSAGSGKTTTIKKLIPNLHDFEILNVDDAYEELLQTAGVGMDIKNFGPEELSIAGQMMGKAQKITKQKYQELTQSLNNIIIDGTGASYGPILKKKQELEQLGYKTFMVALYVAPITALERNITRKRSLPPSIVIRTWRDYNALISAYIKLFGNNFSLINTDDSGDIEYEWGIIKKKYFDTALGKGKPKTGKDLEKAIQDKQKVISDINELVKIQREFDNINMAKNKINKFLR